MFFGSWAWVCLRQLLTFALALGVMRRAGEADWSGIFADPGGEAGASEANRDLKSDDPKTSTGHSIVPPEQRLRSLTLH